MPYSTTWTPRGVSWRYWGRVTGDELLRSNREVYGDPRFSGIRYQLVDLSEVESFDVSPHDMAVLAEADHAAARINPSIRVAVAAPNEMIRILSLYYEAESSDSPWEQQIFDSLADAQAWASRMWGHQNY